MEIAYEAYLKGIGKNVRHFRKRKGLTLEILADKAEIDIRQLGRFERGEGGFTFFTLYKIAEALEIEPYIFLMQEKGRI
jgi:transcriptional regulator with XRE-family HTH domain